MGYGWLKPGPVQNIFLGLTILASLAAPFLVLTALVALAIRQRGNPWAVIVQAGLCAAICIPAKVDEEAIFLVLVAGLLLGVYSLAIWLVVRHRVRQTRQPSARD